MGKMGYSWKTAFLFMLLFTVLCLAGCRDTAVLYDSGGEETGNVPAGETADSGEAAEEAAGETASRKTAESVICVYVCGEVHAPGVYELPESARVVDAVEAAGGMTEKASDTWLNLAELLSDGQKIEVPSAERAEELLEEEKEAESGLVNLNTASAEELMTLTGVGEAKARAILDYREEHGGFQKPEDLMEIPGIKEGVFQKIKDQITV